MKYIHLNTRPQNQFRRQSDDVEAQTVPTTIGGSSQPPRGHWVTGFRGAARRQGWPVGVPSRVVQGRCRAQAGSDGSYMFLSTSSAPSPPPGARLEGAGLADHPGLAGWAAPAAGERVRRCPARAGRCFCTIASIRTSCR